MSGVGVSGLIANLPGTITPYPTQDPNLEKGGFRNDVATIAARNAIPANFRTEGMQVYVRSTKCIYALLSDLTTWSAPIANVNLGAQATWFINPDNSTGLASDQNDGLTALTPLLTYAEYQARCFPGGQRLFLKNSTTTITILAATAQSIAYMFFNFGADASVPGTVAFVNIVGSFTSTAAMTLNAVTQMNATTNTRGQLATTGGAFTNDERVRVTSGTANGAICYSMGLVSATNTYVGPPCVDESTVLAWPSVGDTVVVDTLLQQVGRFELHVGCEVRARVKDLKITRAMLFCPDLPLYTGGGTGIIMHNCVATSTGGTWLAPFGASYVNCRVQRTSKNSFVAGGSGNMFLSLNVQGVAALSGGVNAYGIWINGGNVIFGSHDSFNHLGQGAIASKIWLSPPTVVAGSLGSLEAENGPGPLATLAAVTIAPGTVVVNDSFQSELWGASGGYPVGLEIIALGWLWFSANPLQAVVSFIKIAATVAMRICGVDFAQTTTPIAFNKIHGGIVVQPQPLAPQVETYINRTGQTAAIAVTALLGAAVARKGTYRVRGYIAPTVAGAAGTLTLNAVYTDESGATITQPICSINNTVLSGAGGSVEAECDGATAVSYSVTGYSAGLTYNVRVGVELDSAGA